MNEVAYVQDFAIQIPIWVVIPVLLLLVLGGVKLVKWLLLALKG